MISQLSEWALKYPAVYDSYQSLVGERSCHQYFLNQVVRPESSERVLDIGCGVGASARFLPQDIDYVGVDIDARYIMKARANYGSSRRFIRAGVEELEPESLGVFHKVFAAGVLHHLSDDIALKLMNVMRRVLLPGGSFYSIDPCYVHGQHWISKLLIDHDRGRQVRTPEGYYELLSQLGTVECRVRHDLLRVPYTKAVCEVKLETVT